MTAEPSGLGGGASAAAGNPDSVEHSLGIDGPGLVNVLNGGLAVEYFEPIRPDDVITAVARLGEYSERGGRSDSCSSRPARPRGRTSAARS